MARRDPLAGACPSSSPMVASAKPSSAATDANVRRMSWERASASPAASNRSAMDFFKSADPVAVLSGKTCPPTRGRLARSSRAGFPAVATSGQSLSSVGAHKRRRFHPSAGRRFSRQQPSQGDQPQRCHGRWAALVKLAQGRGSRRAISEGVNTLSFASPLYRSTPRVGLSPSTSPRFSAQLQIPPNSSTTRAAAPGPPSTLATPSRPWS